MRSVGHTANPFHAVTDDLSIEALCKILQQPETYPHDPDSIRLVQTHISVVALVPPFVYKVKKPVDFGFLDFTSLDKRRSACEAEVRLNQRLCTNVYLGVSKLVSTSEGFQFADSQPASGTSVSENGDPSHHETEIAEVAVKMRHLDPDGFLHHRAESGDLTQSHIDAVVDTLVSFYDDCASTPAIAERGWIDHLRINTNENFEQTRDHVGTLIERPAYHALQDYTSRFYDAHAALLNQRRTGGYFVEGHGDLRLEHVHLSGDRLCIYDCIEFNERFRELDIANDIAFLAMDLDGHGCQVLSRYFVNQMAERLDDPDLKRVATFYKVYRAYVRGKVEGMQAIEDEVPESDQAESVETARAHYQWALRYAVAGSRPSVVVVMGRTGTGKTTQATALADALGWTHVSSDRIRKKAAGLPLEERTPERLHSTVYATEMSDRVYEAMIDQALQAVEDGRGAVLDATYGSAARRNLLREALQEAGASYAVVELQAEHSTRKQRLERRETESTVSDARVDVMDAIDQSYEAPSALWDAYHVRVPTSQSVEETSTDVLRALIRLRDA